MVESTEEASEGGQEREGGGLQNWGATECKKEGGRAGRTEAGRHEFEGGRRATVDGKQMGERNGGWKADGREK